MISVTHIIFYVADVTKALSFYNKVFNLSPTFIHESNQYAELATGNIKIAFASDILGSSNLSKGYYKNNQKTAPAGCEIVFTTTDVNVLFNKAIAAGARELAKPIQKPWGQTVAYVQDPLGILIEIASIMNEKNA